jgi:hypothetical protein
MATRRFFKDESETDDTLVAYPLDTLTEIYSSGVADQPADRPEIYAFYGADYYLLGLLPESSGAGWGVMTFIDDDFLEEPISSR